MATSDHVHKWSALAIASIALVASRPTLAQTREERYLLQEHCGKQSAATFKAEWSSNVVNTTEGQVRANYQSHYNQRLNMCFYLEISTTYKSGAEPFKTLRLFDINENKEYATFGGTATRGDLICSVGEVHCASEQEFMRLLDPYMKD
ncbi:hypothetical protein [Bradyrhizobium guangdongense]